MCVKLKICMYLHTTPAPDAPRTVQTGKGGEGRGLCGDQQSAARLQSWEPILFLFFGLSNVETGCASAVGVCNKAISNRRVFLLVSPSMAVELAGQTTDTSRFIVSCNFYDASLEKSANHCTVQCLSARFPGLFLYHPTTVQ